MRAFQLFIVIWFFMISCTSCQDDKEQEIPESSQVIYHNAKIYTVNPNQEWAEAMTVENGVITAIGTLAEVESTSDANAQKVDIGGKMILPGLHDVHMHPLEASSSNFDFVISDDIDDPEDYYDQIFSAHTDNAGDGWLLGWGHYLHTVLEAQRTPRKILDDITTERPIAIMEQTSHSLWVNSKALEVGGYTAQSEDPTGGVIMKDQNGDPNGILIDNAGNILLDLALSPSPERLQKDRDGLINFGLPELAKNGITSICDARTYWKRDHQTVWKDLAFDNMLTVRVNLGLWIYPDEADMGQISAIRSMYEDDDKDLLKTNQIKVYIDGIIPNTTAAMHDHYKIDLFNRSENKGLNYLSRPRLEFFIRELESKGYDFHIHAIGNRGIHEALNAIENAGSVNGRHRITHVELAESSDIQRFADLNVIADCQVAGDFTQPDQWHENDEFIDPSLSDNFIPIKSLVDAGARLTLSSDWDVSTLNPFVGMQNAITRSPQNISMEDAINAYTINAAYVMRQEDIVGSLEVGKEADFIILSQNLFEINPAQINSTRVIGTYLQGEKIFGE